MEIAIVDFAALPTAEYGSPDFSDGLYAHDVDAKSKHEAAKSVLREHWSERNGVVSTQVLQEFYVNVTRKIPRPISKESARLVVSGYVIWCVDTTSAEISTAF